MIERARPHALPKLWGVEDLRPWSTARQDGNAIGEIWYDRSDKRPQIPSLLLKLLFTSQPLSIQVHPDDTFAHSAGLPGGKTEAWYVLSAAPEAKVALGLSRRLTPQQLRAAIDDGSISDLIVWRAVSADDVIFVPAGTIHAIGAGLVIAELQQRSDTTFRLFDYGRKRELHIEKAIAVADTGTGAFSGATEPTYHRAETFRFQTRTSYSSGSISRQTPVGVWKRNARPGFSFSAAVLSPDHSMLPRARPFSRNQTTSTYTPAPAVWRASWRIRAADRFRVCCSPHTARLNRRRTATGHAGATSPSN